MATPISSAPDRILFALPGKRADQIIEIDAGQRLGLLHLKEHLTPQRRVA
jgi:hypothetical protein